MTLAVWHGHAADESSGDLVVLSSPSVTVTDRSDGSTPQVYADRDGDTALGNPFTADADGNIEFYVPPGRYKIEATAGGNTVTWDNELIGTLHGIDSPTDGSVPEYDDANDRYTQIAPEDLNAKPTDPEHATDSATDTYDSATNTTPPADGVQIVRDFQSASTTTTPTLDGKTLTTRDGSALWAGAVSGVHALQRDETADTYLVLNPRGASGVVTPQMFGAVADGTTDDATAIQAALDSLSGFGGIVHFPTGKYRFNTSLTIPDNVGISGLGRTQASTEEGTTLIIGADVVGIQATGIFNSLRGFLLKKTGTHTSTGIVVNALTRTDLRDIHVNGMGNHGIDIQRGNSSYLENIRSDGNGGDGLHIEDIDGAPIDVMAGTAVSLDLINNTGDGLHIVNGASWNMIGITSQQNDRGYHIEGNRNSVSGWVESNTTNDLLIASGVRGCIVKIPNADPDSQIITDNGSRNQVFQRVGSTQFSTWSQVDASLFTVHGSPIETAKAWVDFDGTGTVAIQDSFNVSSITDNATGDYTVNFDTAFATVNYAFSISASGGQTEQRTTNSPTVGSLRVYARDPTNLSNAIDCAHFSVICFGAQ